MTSDNKNNNVFNLVLLAVGKLRDDRTVSKSPLHLKIIHLNRSLQRCCTTPLTEYNRSAAPKANQSGGNKDK